MKRLCLLSSLCLLLLIFSSPVSAADRDEEVRTKVAFAKAFADRDAKKFFSYVADDAQFLGQQDYAREARSDRELVRIFQTSSRTFPLGARARGNKCHWRPGILQRSRSR